jgi:hypothetical protein
LKKSQATKKTKPKIRIKAHHIPALKIACTAEQPLRNTGIIKSNG